MWLPLPPVIVPAAEGHVRPQKIAEPRIIQVRQGRNVARTQTIGFGVGEGVVDPHGLRLKPKGSTHQQYIVDAFAGDAEQGPRLRAKENMGNADLSSRLVMKHPEEERRGQPAQPCPWKTEPAGHTRSTGGHRISPGGFDSSTLKGLR